MSDARASPPGQIEIQPFPRSVDEAFDPLERARPHPQANLVVLRCVQRLPLADLATALSGAVWDLVGELGYRGLRLLVPPQNAAARALHARLGFTERTTGFCERIREE
jgi:hypothetical protein